MMKLLMNKSNVSMAQIAKACGVSRATVSYVLGNTPNKVKPETREQVLRVAKEMGYRTNMAAQAINRGQSKGIGVVMQTSSPQGTLPPQVLKGLQLEAQSRDYFVAMSYFSRHDPELPRIVKETIVDGLVFNFTHEQDRTLFDSVQQWNIPHVWFNVLHPHNSVIIDDRGGGRALAQHFVAMGHKHIAYVHNFDLHLPGEHYSIAHRFQGCHEEAQAEGLDMRLWTPPERLSDSDMHGFMNHKLDTHQEVSAVICYDNAYVSTVQLYAQLNQRSITCGTFSDYPLVSMGQAIPTMTYDQEQAGRVIVSMLCDAIQGKPEADNIAIPMRLSSAN